MGTKKPSQGQRSEESRVHSSSQSRNSGLVRNILLAISVVYVKRCEQLHCLGLAISWQLPTVLQASGRAHRSYAAERRYGREGWFRREADPASRRTAMRE